MTIFWVQTVMKQRQLAERLAFIPAVMCSATAQHLSGCAEDAVWLHGAYSAPCSQVFFAQKIRKLFMSDIPEVSTFRSGRRYVRDGVVYGKIVVTKDVVEKLKNVIANPRFDVYMDSTEAGKANLLVSTNMSLRQRESDVSDRRTPAVRNKMRSVIRSKKYYLKFIRQAPAKLDATGKNTFPAAAIVQGVNNLLSTLQTDHIDVVFFPWPTSETLVDETLGAYDSLQKEGKILALGGMDLSAAELTNILSVADAKGLPGYQVLAVNYNLFDRSVYEGALQDLVVKENIAALPYTSLADGFLTGKYRTLNDLIDNPLSAEIANYFTPRGFAILDAQAAIAAKYGVPAAAVALSWLMNQPGVATPVFGPFAVADAEEADQVATAAVEMRLSAEDIALLTNAGQ
ncbi:aldo/keto reductase [Kosakonia oryzae]|uniref:Aldo/keto reductase n=1 Tax=Kosakonia oryzae TaxID=497725 RepID=A0ABX7PYF8_9ENTR|nr:aldo/keto reductase [Kosakonia oryzae]QSV12518.1 aldo/keto reductase [Kosakonia oryzae]